MAMSVQSPADLCNVALARIGYKMRIGSLYEGSAAAKKLLDVYAQTRDEVLRSYDWGFAERNASLTLLKQAPAGGYVPGITTWDPAIYPALPWFFSYTYPDDCLKVRSVKQTPIFIPNFSPVYNVFSIENDQTYSPPQKVLLCNVPSAVLTYTGSITNPLDWEADFVEAFASALGQRIAPVLMGMDATKLEAQDAAQQQAQAETERG